MESAAEEVRADECDARADEEGQGGLQAWQDQYLSQERIPFNKVCSAELSFEKRQCSSHVFDSPRKGKTNGGIQSEYIDVNDSCLPLQSF